MRKTDNENFWRLFDLGIIEFNMGNLNKAHETWESIWKDGNDKEKINIKGLIQLSVGLMKCKNYQYKAGIYLLEKSIKNIKNAKDLKSKINIMDIVTESRKILNTIEKNDSLKFELRIKRIKGRSYE